MTATGFNRLRLSLILLIVVNAGFISCLPLRESRATNNKFYSGNKLILILMDGFRWDYLSRPGLPTFDRIIRQGVHAEYLDPVFPTLSKPNHYSLVTGRYSESHGITGNDMYNPDTGEIWKQFSNDTSQSHWWEGAEPMWVTTTKNGLRTDMHMWAGCRIAIFNTTPASCTAFNGWNLMEMLENDLRDVANKMERDETDVGMVFSAQPDLAGHIFGPDSSEMNSVLQNLDAVLGRFLIRLEGLQIHNKVNILFASDHGMTRLDSEAVKRIEIANYLDGDSVNKLTNHGAMIGIYPKKGKSDEIIQSLTGINGTHVWKKNDLPDRLHFKSVNTPPVIILADREWLMVKLPNNSETPNGTYLGSGIFPPSRADALYKGTHGYDSDGFSDMRGIFFGFGPDLKVGLEAPGIKIVDVYNLAMTLIGLTPIANNGTWDSVKDFLRCPPTTCGNQ